MYVYEYFHIIKCLQIKLFYFIKEYFHVGEHTKSCIKKSSLSRKNQELLVETTNKQFASIKLKVKIHRIWKIFIFTQNLTVQKSASGLILLYLKRLDKT